MQSVPGRRALSAARAARRKRGVYRVQLVGPRGERWIWDARLTLDSHPTEIFIAMMNP